MSNIEKIRQEIERRKNKFYKKLPHAYYPESCNSKEEERAIGIYGELTDLLSFLDTLSEEKQSENLEKAANNCIAEFADYVMAENAPKEINLTEKLREIFKAGAEWIAGQGVSTVAISSTEDGITEEGMKLIADYLGSLPDKTEVVLQIRKK